MLYVVWCVSVSAWDCLLVFVSVCVFVHLRTCVSVQVLVEL